MILFINSVIFLFEEQKDEISLNKLIFSKRNSEKPSHLSYKIASITYKHF